MITIEQARNNGGVLWRQQAAWRLMILQGIGICEISEIQRMPVPHGIGQADAGEIKRARDRGRSFDMHTGNRNCFQRALHDRCRMAPLRKADEI